MMQEILEVLRRRFNFWEKMCIRDRYRTYSYNGAEYSGYEDVSHALSALETKIQQIEQAEAEK